MNVEFYAPLLLSIIMSFGWPSFQILFSGLDRSVTLRPVEATAAGALSISGVGLAMAHFTAGAACALIVLGVVMAPAASRFVPNPAFRIMVSLAMFLLYLRVGGPAPV